MLTAYRPLLSVPGAQRFIVGAALSRIGGAMFGVAVIVMVSTRRDSYALAGSVSAVGVVVMALASPVIGGLVDRWGQRRASLPFVISSTVICLLTALVSWLDAPAWTLFVGYGLAAILPEMGPMSRTRWAHIYEHDDGMLHTAMSFEQVMEESAFVVGPVLAVLASTTLFPEAGFILAAIIFLVGSVIFLAGRDTEPPVVPHEHRPPGLAVHNPGVLVIATAAVMVGVIFGANEVIAVAVAEEFGDKAFSSVILAAFAFASAVTGFWYGTRTFTMSMPKRLLLCGLGMFVLELPALVAPNLWALAGIMFVAGSATAPTLITALTLLQKLVPKAQLTEGMAVGVTGILVGISLGTSVSGWAVEHLGAQEAYAVPVAAGALAVVVLVVHLGRLERATPLVADAA